MQTHRQFRYDPDIGYTFIPNLKVRLPHETGGYLVRTNSLGFRDDRTPGATSSRRRVFVFGDSFTAGDGVSNGHRYSDELQRNLTDVDVYNFGLPGSGTDQQLIAYRKFARGLDCDLLIVGVLVEDIRRVTSQFRTIEAEQGNVAFQAKPYFELVDGRLVRHHEPVPDNPLSEEELAADNMVDKGGRFPVLRRLVSSLGLKDAIQRLTEYQPVPDYDSAASSGWQLMRAILLEWRLMHKGPMLVAPLPLYQHVEQTAQAKCYQARFSELAAESDIVVHDVLPDLLSYEISERRGFRFKTDVHLTRSGHQAIARSLVPVVADLLRSHPRATGEYS